MAYSKARRLSDLISSTGEVSSYADASIVPADLHSTLDLTGKTITVATASSGDSDTSVASTAFVQQELASLVDSAPGSLNTLNELAAAVNDDANFSTTITNSIATKLPLAGGTLTGAVTGTSFTAPQGFLGGSNGGIRIHTSGTKFFNITAANAAQDNVMDVGASDARFKNAYFSGTIQSNTATMGTSNSFATFGSNSGSNGVAISRDGNASSYPDIVVTSAGKVGIGHDSPTTKMHLKESNNSAGALYTAVGPGNVPSLIIQNSGTTDNNNAPIYFMNDTHIGASVSAKFVSHSTDETDLVFSTTDSSGNGRERLQLRTNSRSGADFIGVEGPNAMSSMAGDNWNIHADRAMSVVQDDNNASNWMTMKSFHVSQNANTLTIKFNARNQSGAYWWAWRIYNATRGEVVKKSDQSTNAQGPYYSGVASGSSASVHGNTPFDIDIGTVFAGDLIQVQMVNSNGSGTPVAGTQYLYMKEFTVSTLDTAKPVGSSYFATMRRPMVYGPLQITGDNGNEYTKGSIEIPFYLESGTHNIIELAEWTTGTTGVATMDYVGLYDYAGRNMGQGRAMSSTRRRSSNSDWEDIDGATVHSANGANGSITHPDFYWADGVLKVGVSSSLQITGRIRVTWHNATIQRHYDP